MTITMTAARASRGGAALSLETIPVPQPGPDDVLVQVESAGLAPGMMKLLEHGRFKHLPSTPGHEIAGTVVAAGELVDPGLLGQRVRIHPMLSCGDCDYCRSDREQMCRECAMIGHAAFGDGPLVLYERYHDGGLAEFARAPAFLVDVLPDNVSFDVGAKIHDLANAVRALKCAALPASGRLAITAATGTMGTATIKLARFHGARELVLVGRSRERLEALRPLAGDLPVQLVALEELAPGWEDNQGLAAALRGAMPPGPDAVIDYVPSGPSLVQAAASMALGGTFLHMGGNPLPLPFPISMVMQKCWKFVGTRACTRADTADVIRLLASGALQPEDLITHRFALADVNAALSDMMNRPEPMWMSVVRPQSTAKDIP